MGAVTLSVKVLDTELCVGVCESVTVTVKLKVPPVGGVPVNSPVLLIESQAGRPDPVTA